MSQRLEAAAFNFCSIKSILTRHLKVDGSKKIIKGVHATASITLPCIPIEFKQVQHEMLARHHDVARLRGVTKKIRLSGKRAVAVFSRAPWRYS
jgi:hypothetical protein